jgi:hypothetical protein
MEVSATSEAPRTRGVRPPTAVKGELAPPSGVAGHPPERPTAGRRPDLSPAAWPAAEGEAGFATSDPYVRRFWTAAIGPGAVADLMRLAVAAQRGRSLPRPESLTTLVREDLARWVGDRLFVRTTVPPLSRSQERRLTPGLRREHRTLR